MLPGSSSRAVWPLSRPVLLPLGWSVPWADEWSCRCTCCADLADLGGMTFGFRGVTSSDNSVGRPCFDLPVGGLVGDCLSVELHPRRHERIWELVGSVDDIAIDSANRECITVRFFDACVRRRGNPDTMVMGGCASDIAVERGSTLPDKSLCHDEDCQEGVDSSVVSCPWRDVKLQ